MTTMSDSVRVFCANCNATGDVDVLQVTASLRCRACGSGDLGLVGVDPRPSHVLAQRGGAVACPECGERFSYDQRGGQDAAYAQREDHIMQKHPNDGADGQYGYLYGHERTAAQGGLSIEAQQRLAAPHGPGTGWGQPHPDPLQGWSEYAGPTPQTFPRSAPVADSRVCPVCHGSKYDLIDKGPCRECGGTGYITHPTDAPVVQNNDPGRRTPPGGAGWRGASISGDSNDRLTQGFVDGYRQSRGGLTTEAQAKVGGRISTSPYGSPESHIRATSPDYRSPGARTMPFDPDEQKTYYPKADERSPNLRDWTPAQPPTGPYQMDLATCPSCGHAPTVLSKDKNEDAWWACPRCGPLANIDQRPEINPYSPPQGFEPDRSMKTGGFLSRNRKTGRLLNVLAVIHERNELDAAEAVDLARKTVLRYGEGR